MTRHRSRLVALALVLPLVLLTASFASAHAAAGAAQPAPGKAKYTAGYGHAHVPRVKTGSGPERGGRPHLAPPGTIPGAFSGVPSHEKGEADAAAQSGQAPTIQAPTLQDPLLGGAFNAFNEVTDKDLNIPPDSAIAAGPFQVVVVVNTVIKVFNKNGTQVSSMPLSQFFGSANSNNDGIFDPRAFYDPGLDRFWVVAVSENDNSSMSPGNRSTILVALSNSNDASDLTNGWRAFGMDATVEPPQDTSPKWCDYPMLGVDADSIFISCNMFDFPSVPTPTQSKGSFEFAKLRVLSKAQFVNNQCCNWTFFEDLHEGGLVGTDSFSIQPAIEHGATAADGEWLVDAENCPTCSSTLTVWHYTGGTNLDSASLSVGGFPQAPLASQPGPQPSNIATGDPRLQFAFWQNGHLSTSQTIACSNSPGGACVAYTEIDVSGGLNSMGLVNDFFFGGFDGQDRYYPAVDVNAAGDKTMVYSISGPKTFIGTDAIAIPHTVSCVTGQCFNPTENTVTVGNGSYQQLTCNPNTMPGCGPVNRWGDYSSAAVDPDGTGIWVHGEFAAPVSGGLVPWGTVVGLTYEAQDLTPPVTTALVDPTPVSGWNNSNHVFVTLNATDPESGVRSITWSVSGAETLPPTTVFNTSVAFIGLQNEGVSIIQYQATDDWGNVENPKFLTVRIDRTPPSMSCSVPDSVWHATDQSSACSASDALSGLANPADASFTLTTSVPAGTETASAFTGTRSVCDVAGNCTTAGPIGPFMVDKEPPVITITSPNPSTTYTLNQVVAASYGCTDGGSGVASCTGPVPSGGALDTSTVGMHQFTVNAVDNVGNKSSLTVTYFVSYAVCLQYDPTKALPAAVYPFRIELCDAFGTDVSSSSVTVTAFLIMPGAITPTSSAQPSNRFVFDPTIGTSGGYVYVLRTAGLLHGSYQLFVSVTGDPNAHTLPFLIK